MLRRTFFKLLLGSALIPTAVSGARAPRTRLLHESPLAGFQYYDGSPVWPALAVGDPLTLEREPANPFDPRAVAVYWQARKLGYLPRVENTAAAQLMDHAERLHGRISVLSDRGGLWERLPSAVYLTA